MRLELSIPLHFRGVIDPASYYDEADVFCRMVSASKADIVATSYDGAVGYDFDNQSLVLTFQTPEEAMQFRLLYGLG